MNCVNLIGRLTKDPEKRMTREGISNVKFTLAVDRDFKNPQTGQRDADFINCVAWKTTADLICQYMGKGSQIGVTGRIQTGSYENNQGQRVYTTDVIVQNVKFLDSKNQNQQGYGNQYQQQGYQNQGYQQNNGYQRNQYQPAQNQYQAKAQYRPKAAPQYQQTAYQPQNQYQPQAVSTNQANAFESSDVLSIDSDDLPF